MRVLLQQAIERSSTSPSDYARDGGRSPAERLGAEVVHLARVAAALHLAEAAQRGLSLAHEELVEPCCPEVTAR